MLRYRVPGQFVCFCLVLNLTYLINMGRYYHNMYRYIGFKTATSLQPDEDLLKISLHPPQGRLYGIFWFSKILVSNPWLARRRVRQTPWPLLRTLSYHILTGQQHSQMRPTRKSEFNNTLRLPVMLFRACLASVREPLPLFFSNKARLSVEPLFLYTSAPSATASELGYRRSTLS
ncbi:hypothetical protein P389DRAFT_35342 [Cystobasidium minutum MCA 4210]|uniref:uncharacterized protein n=1 Tax=Cystobasidium minutum MCA 4210 TaxID=1397322 RepID=UPI0034CFEA6B|eukprot:jgi/Rhomi1/35342/CE35341_805